MVENALELRNSVEALLKEKKFEEVDSLLKEVLEQATTNRNEALKAEALRCKASLLYHRVLHGETTSQEDTKHQLSQALELLEEASNLARYYGDVAQQVWMRLTLADIRAYQLEMTRVSHLLEDALQRSKRNDDKHMVLETILYTAKIYEKHGLLQQKEGLVDEALMLSQTLDEKRLLPWFLAFKAKIELLKGDLDTVDTLQEEVQGQLSHAISQDELVPFLERVKAEEAYLRAQMSAVSSTVETMKGQSRTLFSDLTVIETVLVGEEDQLPDFLAMGERLVADWQFDHYLARALYLFSIHRLFQGDSQPSRQVIDLLLKRIRLQKGMDLFYRYLYESLSGHLTFVEKNVENALDHFMAASRGFNGISKELRMFNDIFVALTRVLNWIANLDAESLDEAKKIINNIIEETREQDLILYHAKGLLAAVIIYLVGGEVTLARNSFKSVQQLVTRHGLTFIQNKLVPLEEALDKYEEGVPPEERSALLDELIKTLDF